VFGEVIVPLDGSLESARALEPAATVARSLDSTLRAVALTTATHHFEIEEAVQAQVAELTDVRFEVLVEEATEPVPDRIAALVEAAPASLVCMTTKGRGRTAAITGSVATDLLRQLAGPVLLIGPECRTDRFSLDGPMVVTVDESDRSNAILPIAESWVIVFGYEPEIVTVLDPKTDAAMRAASHSDLVGDVAMDTVMVRRLARHMEEVVKVPVSFESLHGPHTAEEILRHAALREATLIAMATHGDTGVNRLVFGSIAAKVVHGATCPVLIIRPPDL
jgi:nucleotide-binding universal stress UspA family protein